MLAVIQRVDFSDIKVEEALIAKISVGILALIGIEKNDTEKNAEKLLDRILNYRIFSDEAGKMNLNIQTIAGDLLLVPQFTIVADTNSGTRPGFSTAMPPSEGVKLFEYMVRHAKLRYANVQAGQFGADMKINLCNNGPVTFLLKA